MDVDIPPAPSKELITVKPTHFSSLDKIQFLELDDERLCVRYIGKAQHHHDVGAIRANSTLQNDTDVAYFEIELLDFTPGTKMAVGLTDSSFVLDALPGSQPKSCGYTADGEIWINGHRKLPAGKPFKEGSFVGCGVVYPTGQLFFTLDGEIVKTEENFGGKLLYPTVGLHAVGQTIQVNFGGFGQHFYFDLAAKRREVLAASLRQIDALPTPSFSRVIYNYLLFHAYKDSAEAFAATNPSELEPLTERDTMLLSTLDLRAQLRRWILGAELQSAKTQLISHFGDIAAYSEAMFNLDCQIFIEHIRRKELAAALEISQTIFLYWWSDITQQQIEDCCALIAYSFPEKSPAAHMLSPTRLEQVAELVNRSILQWTGITGIVAGEDESDLTRLLAHLANVHHEIRLARGAGDPFALENFSQPPPPPLKPVSPAPTSLTTSGTSITRPLSAATSTSSLRGSRRG